MGTFEMHWRAELTWCPGRPWDSLQCRCQGCQVCTQDEVRVDQGMQYISASSQQLQAWSTAQAQHELNFVITATLCSYRKGANDGVLRPYF